MTSIINQLSKKPEYQYFKPARRRRRFPFRCYRSWGRCGWECTDMRSEQPLFALLHLPVVLNLVDIPLSLSSSLNSCRLANSRYPTPIARIRCVSLSWKKIKNASEDFLKLLIGPTHLVKVDACGQPYYKVIPERLHDLGVFYHSFRILREPVYPNRVQKNLSLPSQIINWKWIKHWHFGREAILVYISRSNMPIAPKWVETSIP